MGGERIDPMRRIFVPLDRIKEDRIVVTGGDVKHIKDVLRMKPGDEITASDGRGTSYGCVLSKIGSDEIILSITERNPDISELPVKITLFQALPKGDKMDLIIQKAVELGVTGIYPVATARSVTKLTGEKAEKKVGRWQKIAIEAAKQCGRGIVPAVGGVVGMPAACELASDSDLIYIPYELSEDISSIGRIREDIRGVESIAVFIGAEGGFERSEVESVIAKGAKVISLGHRILRTETAAIAMLSHLMLLIEGES